MRFISGANLTYLAGNELTLCKCVKLTLRDGTVMGFTDHDADLTISAVTYRAKVGMSVGSLRWSSNLQDERTELEGIFSSLTGGLTEDLARQGYYNEALCEIFLANWLTSASIVPLKRGVVASFLPRGGGYTAEVRSLPYPLSRRLVVRQVTQQCTAELGDTRCTFSAAVYTGAVTDATALTVTDSGFTEPGDPTDLIGGRFVLTTGPLAWFFNKVKSYDSGTKTFTMARPFPSVPGIGGTLRAYEGCPKTLAACRDRFSNLVNFRGFPYVPDRDEAALAVYPDNAAGGYVVGTGEDD
jgi:uncharacterized phage protein (TIGR02218 family)